MAYPTSAITFTTKSAGDTIQAAHVNDLQTEVTALESALLTGGLAHNLVPSADSTRTLGSSALRWIIHGSQVTDGTLPLTALSSGTLSTNITVPGVSLTTYVQARLATPQVIDTASPTKILLDGQNTDLLAEYDSTLARFTPASSGYYSVTGRAHYNSANGRVYNAIYVSGAAVAIAEVALAGASDVDPHVTTILHLSTAQYLELYGYHETGSSVTLSSGLAYTALEIIRLF